MISSGLLCPDLGSFLVVVFVQALTTWDTLATVSSRKCYFTEIYTYTVYLSELG